MSDAGSESTTWFVAPDATSQAARALLDIQSHGSGPRQWDRVARVVALSTRMRRLGKLRVSLRVICVTIALSYNRGCTIAQWLLRRSLLTRKVPTGCLQADGAEVDPP
jgi:hypothetical protein